MTGTITGTGVTRHQEQVIARVESLLGAALSLMPLGCDFTLCNARPIADQIAVEFVYQPQFNEVGLMKSCHPIILDSDGTCKPDDAAERLAGS
jgi:hypothetical protein